MLSMKMSPFELNLYLGNTDFFAVHIFGSMALLNILALQIKCVFENKTSTEKGNIGIESVVFIRMLNISK